MENSKRNKKNRDRKKYLAGFLAALMILGALVPLAIELTRVL